MIKVQIFATFRLGENLGFISFLTQLMKKGNVTNTFAPTISNQAAESRLELKVDHALHHLEFMSIDLKL